MDIQVAAYSSGGQPVHLKDGMPQPYFDDNNKQQTMKKTIVLILLAAGLLGGCNQKLYDGMKKREVNKEIGR